MIDTTLFELYKPQRIFLVQGQSTQYDELVQKMKQDNGLVHTLMVARFTVEHAAVVATFATEGNGLERVLVVYFSVFSSDAAQLLLKSLEEPDPLTTIIFITPYPYIVPITIRSRVALIQTTRSSVNIVSRTKAEALEYIKNELSGDTEDNAATRRANVIGFLDQLETEYKAHTQKVRIIYEAKHMLFRANLPTKFVMEYVVAAVY
jgi:hypothetical protein